MRPCHTYFLSFHIQNKVFHFTPLDAIHNRVSAEGPDGSDGKSRLVLDPPENIFRPMFSGVS